MKIIVYYLNKVNRLNVDFFKADITDFGPEKMYDIIFCSGVFHFLFPNVRKEFVSQLKEHTNADGLDVINVFVDKPFIKRAPDYEVKKESRADWLSGELFMLYHDWYLKQSDEVVFDCFSGGVPHQHCMDIHAVYVIIEKRISFSKRRLIKQTFM